MSDFSDAGAWPLLDIEHAVALLGGSVVAYRDVAQVFLEHLTDAIAALAGSSDPHELLPVVHELGSSLGAVGAMRAHRVACTIEAWWRRGQTDDAAQSIAVLRAMVAVSVEALTAAIAP